MTEIQLSDTQAVILSAACARDDGHVFPLTSKLNGGVVASVLKSLLKRGLIEEIRATDLNTAWRHDEDRGSITLRAAPLAYQVLGIVDAEETTAPRPSKSEDKADPTGTPRQSKQDRLIAMLRSPDGATVAEIAAAIGWQAHTVRGAMSGALKKKLGLTIASERVEGRGRIYRIAS